MTPRDEDIAESIEIRGLYDGVSVYRLNDGRYVNRWPKGDPRHERVQAWIEKQAAIDAARSQDKGGEDGR